MSSRHGRKAQEAAGTLPPKLAASNRRAARKQGKRRVLDTLAQQADACWAWEAFYRRPPFWRACRTFPEGRDSLIQRMVAGMLIALGLLISMTACNLISAEPVDSSAIVGTWTAKGPEGHSAVLNMRKDGTYSARVPSRVFGSFTFENWGSPPDWDHAEELNGTWRVQWMEQSKQASVHVYTGDAKHSVGVGQLFIEQTNEKPIMKLYIGDPDEGVYLKFEGPQ